MQSILFVGRRNAARSIMAETCFNATGTPDWRAFSAGWQPQMEIDRTALKVLAGNGFGTEGLSSKPIEIFAQAGAPEIHLCVFLDEALPGNAGDYPGEHMHWSLPDPSAEGPGSRRSRYEAALAIVTVRVSELVFSGRLLTSAPLALAG